MSPQKLVTQCPYCDTRFRITEEQLDAAGGKARCSRCHRVFNARAYLQEGSGKASRGEAAQRGRSETAPAPQPAPPPVATERPGFTATPSIDLDIESSVAAGTGTEQVDFELASDFDAPEDPFPSQRLTDEPTPEFQPVDTPPPTPETAETDESAFAFDAAEWELPAETDAIDSAVDAAGEQAPASEFDFDIAGRTGDNAADESGLTSEVEHSLTEDADTGEIEFEFGELTSDEVATVEHAEDEETTLGSPSWSSDSPETTDPLFASIAEIDAMEVDDDGYNAPESLPDLALTAAVPTSNGATADQESVVDSALDNGDERESSYEQAIDALQANDSVTESLFAGWGHAAAQESTDQPQFADEVPQVEVEAAFPSGDTALFDEPEPDLPESDTPPPLPEADERRAEPYSSALAQELEATLTQRKRYLPTLLFGTGSLVLLALLLVQAGSTFRAEISQYPALAPIASRFCEGQECVAPEKSAPERIRIVNRDVRPHPEVAGALLISLSFVNEAEFPQAYPTLEVSFSDIHAQLIALRRFQPAEYLGGERRSSSPLPPGELVALSLSVVDPGEQGVSFRFEFY